MTTGHALLTVKRSIFHPRAAEHEFVPAGQPIRDYWPRGLERSQHVVRSLNGSTLADADLEQLLQSGDRLLVTVIPGAEFLVPFAISLVVSLVLTGISYAITALTAPSASGRRRNQEESPTYGFDGLVSTVAPGTPYKVIYGVMRDGGHIIGQHIRPSQDTELSDAQAQVGELHTLLSFGFGPVAGISDVRIDKNPVTDFQGVRTETRLGNLYQSTMRGFERVAVVDPRDVALTKAGGQVILTTQAECDAFQITVRFRGGLFHVSNQGNLKKKTVTLRIEYRAVGTTEWKVFRDQEITAATRTQFDFFIEGPPLLRQRVEIGITRITEDDEGSLQENSETTIIGVTAYTDAGLTYPLEPLLAIRQLPTNQVSGATPNYNALVKGKIVRVYTSPTTFTEEWSDSPPWCLLDYLLSPVYGCGRYFKLERIILEDFIAWAAKCKEQKPKYENGPLEDAYTVNMTVDASLSSFDVIKAMCTAGRAVFYQAGTRWGVRFLEPTAPSQLFQMSRIKRDSFEVSMPRRSETANVALGEFINAENEYAIDTLPVPDATVPPGDGQVPIPVNLTGITSPSRAARICRHIVLANRLERRQVTLEVGLEALAVVAGDVFALSHDVPAWGFSGRIVAVDAGGAQLELDREVTMEAGKSYELTVIHRGSDKIDVVRVLSASMVTRTIDVAPTWSTPPVPGLDYAFGEVAKSVKLFWCTDISRGATPNKRRVRGKEYNADVFGDDLSVPTPPSSSQLPDPDRIPAQPSQCSVTERIEYLQDGGLRAVLDVFFSQAVTAGGRVQVWWRELGSPTWEPAGEPTAANRFTIAENVQSPGTTYQISVLSVSPSGNRRHPDQGVIRSITTTGVTRRPPRVENFQVARSVSGLVFSWTPIEGSDLANYEIRNGASWNTGITVGKPTSTPFETGLFVRGTQTFWIKAVSRSGVESAEANGFITTIAGRIGENIVLTHEAAPTFPGRKENFVVSASKLTLDTSTQLVAWLATPQPPAPTAILPGGRGPGFRSSGQYTSDPIQITDQNAVRCLVSVDADPLVTDQGAYWNHPTVGQYTWESDYGRTRSWAGADRSDVKIRYDLRFSSSTSAETSFGPWQPLSQQAEVTAKYAQLRVTVEVLDPALTVSFASLQVLFDVPDVIDSGEVQSSAAGTVDVLFNKAFNQAPKVTASVINATAGDEYFITTITQSGFTLSVKNTGALVSRLVHWVAGGF